jgi:hypothetical protein
MKKTSIALNEDNSHYFSTRAKKTLDKDIVRKFIDQYANTQVSELYFSTNSMRTSFASKVWTPIWKGYKPDAPNGQPLLASLLPEQRQGARDWIHTAWKLIEDGIDIYQEWITRSRELGISPKISVRMNDIHNVDDENCYIHSDFWRENPQFRRAQYKTIDGNHKALDYSYEEVRTHTFKLIEELTKKYDFDGIELDWMRFGYNLRYGMEERGKEILTNFMQKIRDLLTSWEKKRGHKIQLSARVPSRPWTALYLGYDTVTWAKRGLIDALVITPFWATIENDMPIEIWKQLLEGTAVELVAGLELLIRPHPNVPKNTPRQTNSLESVRGTAISFLHRGADKIYLFNYMDSQTTIDNVSEYSTILREIGQISTINGKPRRHIITYSDVFAPGEPRNSILPMKINRFRPGTLRINIGPRLEKKDTDSQENQELQGRVVIGLRKIRRVSDATLTLRVNGKICLYEGECLLPSPQPIFLRTYSFLIPQTALESGFNIIEVITSKKMELGWVEIRFS